MKKALLAVSFGTSHMDTLEKNIVAIEQDLAAAFPDRTLYRAFTSGFIIRKLKKNGLLEVETVDEAMEHMLSDGVDDVIIQTSHMINGEEFDLLKKTMEGWRDRFEKFSFGDPMLTKQEDFEMLCDALEKILPEKEEDRAIILMGHGSPRFSNEAYVLLENMLQGRGRRDIYVGTVEGYPQIGEVLAKLKKDEAVKRVCCQPLLIVAGEHAKNDMNGDEPDSWRSILTAAGYQVECVLKGLGEYPEARAILVKHAKEA